MRSIRAAGCACAVATAVAVAVAGEARESVNLPTLSAWEPSITARLGGGFKDNVALSESQPESSAFLRTAIDAVAVRLPVDGLQTTLLLLGEDTRYFSARTVDHEDFIFGQAELRRFWANGWQAAISLEGAYLDQVIDLSITQTNQTRLAVKGGTFVGRPIARWELSSQWWLMAELPITRQLFDSVPDDYWILAPKLSLGRVYGPGSEVAVSYEFADRPYDEDPARRADRSEIPNETRVTWQHEAQVAWKHYWDARKRFRTLSRASYRLSSDRVGEYFDYGRVQLSQQGRFRDGPWELTAEIRLAWYRFPHQTGAAPNGDPLPEDRERSDLTLIIRAERGLGRHLRLFAEYEHAQTLSNLDQEEYSANTVLGGVGVEF
jgi:hypothetical protein